MKEKEKSPSMTKTIDDVLKQKYVTAKDLQIIIPELSYQRALTYICEAQRIMREKNYFVPEQRTKIALTKIIKQKFGF